MTTKGSTKFVNFMTLAGVHMLGRNHISYVVIIHYFFQNQSSLLPMVAYFCLHLSDNYVDLSDNYVDLSVIYVDLSDHYVDLSEKYHHN